MTKNLRWNKDQLEAYLKKLHAGSSASETSCLKALAALSVKSPMQLLLENKSDIKNWDRVSLKALTSQNSQNLLKNNDSLSKNRLQRKVVLKNEAFLPGDLGTSPASSLVNITEIAEPRRIKQRSRSIGTINNATWTGTYEPGKNLTIVFYGVILLSVNTLYGLTHFERIKYRKRWHDLIERAVLDVVGVNTLRVAFEHYVIHAHRVSKKMADTDAKSGYLKYAIDGLRYSNIIVEDTEKYFRDLFCSQSLGSPMLAIRIESVEKDYIPVAYRDDWAQNILDKTS